MAIPIRKPGDRERRRAARHAAESVMVDGRDEPWARAWQTVVDMIISGRYRFADKFLRDVRDTIEQTGTVTPRQLAAIERVRRAERRPHDFAERWPWPTD